MNTIKEYMVILHTACGDVTTSYTGGQLSSALEHVQQYVLSGKSFSFMTIQ